VTLFQQPNNAAAMTDRNNKPVTVGARVQFKVDGRKWPVVGVVRAIKDGEARCDDGDPDNDDLFTNGFRCSAWVGSKHIEVLP
jgi:hypothetical protein